MSNQKKVSSSPPPRPPEKRPPVLHPRWAGLSNDELKHALADSHKRLRLRTPSTDTGANTLAILSWQPRRADAVWTRCELTALYEHLHNGNGTTHFVMGFRDKDGCKRYVRSKKLPVHRAISWAWSSIAGSPKSRLAFVPYSTNDRQQSRWGGMDFDAHNGKSERALELAFTAFRVLLSAPDLAVILETSGSGGWHVWAISPDFHETREWIRLLKSVVATIGTTVAAGVCEIFPPDSLPSRYGKGLRAPGCWNPGTDDFSQIVWENCRASLDSVLSGKSKNVPLNCRGLESHFPDTKKEDSFSVSLYRESELLQKLGIAVTGTRNEKLSSLVGEVFHQVGRGMAQTRPMSEPAANSPSMKSAKPSRVSSSVGVRCPNSACITSGLSNSPCI